MIVDLNIYHKYTFTKPYHTVTIDLRQTKLSISRPFRTCCFRHINTLLCSLIMLFCVCLPQCLPSSHLGFYVCALRAISMVIVPEKKTDTKEKNHPSTPDVEQSLRNCLCIWFMSPLRPNCGCVLGECRGNESTQQIVS